MEQNVLAGFVSGVCQTVIGHPFDTWKTRIQISKQSSLQSFHKIMYRGLSIPLLFNASYQSFIFTSTHQTQNYTNSWWSAGVLTGLAGGILSVPLEGHKIIRQCQCHNIQFIQIPWKNVLTSSIVRESIGTSIYFGTYYLKQPQLKDKPIQLFAWGGFCGWFSWLFSYPFDTYKTQFQTNMSQTWVQVIKRMPYSGFMVFSIRCFLVNGVGLTVFDKLKPKNDASFPLVLTQQHDK